MSNPGVGHTFLQQDVILLFVLLLILLRLSCEFLSIKFEGSGLAASINYQPQSINQVTECPIKSNTTANDAQRAAAGPDL